MMEVIINVIKHLIDLFNSDFLIIQNPIIRHLAGVILIVWGYADAIKYHFQSQKIREVRSAKGNSRKFCNLAIWNDKYKIFYFFFIIRDPYVLLTSLLALFFMYELFFVIYRFYPYRNRNLLNFKKPHIFLYWLNSLTPNKIRKKL